MMNRICLLCMLCLFAGLSMADNCVLNATLFGTVSMGNVVVQRDALVGSEIGRARLSGYAELMVYSDSSGNTCNGGYVFNYLSATPSAINDVFDTNLQGVGIRLSIPPGNFVLPARGDAYKYNLGFYDVMLIKTGQITSGYLTPGIIVQGWYITPDNYFMRISMDANTQVTVLACSLTRQMINFNLGDISAADFSDHAGFSPAQNDVQNLGLNCDPGANINVELIGTQHPDAMGEPSVLALTGQGGAGTADGVGIQLLYNNIPLRLNNRIVLKQSTGGQETFPLMARYYQTKALVRPGNANATATLNITYQ